jgi:hypothetical protein
MGLENLKTRLKKPNPTIWQNKVIEVKVHDIVLEVHGCYTPAEPSTYDYPGSPSDFQIHAIHVVEGDTDIYDLLSHDFVGEISEMSLKELEW